MKFHKVGTKHKSYMNRLQKINMTADVFSVEIIDKTKIFIIINNEKVDEFSSLVTYNQFILTLEGFEMIKATKNGYLIINANPNWEYITTKIFTESNNKKIQRLRNSRKISLLAKMGLLTQDTIDKINITKTRGNFMMKDALSEASWWEEETIKDINKAAHAVEEIKKWIQNLG